MSKIRNLSDHNSSEIRVVIDALSKLTSRSPEEIEPHLNKLLESLTIKQNSSDLDTTSSSETLTHEQWLVEFHNWIDSHKNRHIPVLSESAMSRASIYLDRW